LSWRGEKEKKKEVRKLKERNRGLLQKRGREEKRGLTSNGKRKSPDFIFLYIPMRLIKYVRNGKDDKNDRGGV